MDSTGLNQPEVPGIPLLSRHHRNTTSDITAQGVAKGGKTWLWRGLRRLHPQFGSPRPKCSQTAPSAMKSPGLRSDNSRHLPHTVEARTRPVAVRLSSGCSAWWPSVGSRYGTSRSSSPHAAALGLRVPKLLPYCPLMPQQRPPGAQVSSFGRPDCGAKPVIGVPLETFFAPVSKNFGIFCGGARWA